MGASTYNAHANQLSYNGWCALGGAANPRLFSREVWVGRAFMGFEYYMV